MPYKVNPTTGQLDYYEVAEGGGGGVATNLTFIPGVTSGTVTSDSGTDADIPLADSTNAGLFSAAEKTKLAGIAAGAEVNVNADWNATTGDALILNKPVIPAAQVNSDWNATTGVAEILNKPTSLPSSFVKHAVKYGEALVKGQAAYVSSSDGTNMIVSKADYSLESTSSKTMGLIITSGATNFQGEILTEGLLAGTGSEPLSTISANAGDPVWLGDDGNLLFGLANKPVAPNHMVFIGIVTRVHAVNGEIFVKVQNGYELNEIHDVSLPSYVNNGVLYRDTTLNLWKSATIQTLLGFTPANNTFNIATTAPLSGAADLSGIGMTLSISQATAAVSGFLTSTDWNTFNNKVPTTRTISTTGPLSGGGDLSSNITLSIAQATASANGFLSSTDWTTFNNKQSAITLTTTGTSGAATFNGTTLNIPQYSGGTSEKSGSVLSTTRSLPFNMGTNIKTYRSASGVGSTTTSSATFAGSTTTFYPISLKEGSPIRALACRVYTAGSAGLGTAHVEFGIYNSTTDAEGNLIPGTLEVQFGKVSTLTTGVKEALLASPYTLGTTVDNIYWIAFRNYSTNSATLNTYSTGDVLSTWMGFSSSTALVKLGSFIADTPYTNPDGLPASLPATGGVGFTQSATVAGYSTYQALVGIR